MRPPSDASSLSKAPSLADCLEDSIGDGLSGRTLTETKAMRERNGLVERLKDRTGAKDTEELYQVKVCARFAEVSVRHTAVVYHRRTAASPDNASTGNSRAPVITGTLLFVAFPVCFVSRGRPPCGDSVTDCVPFVTNVVNQVSDR